MKKFLITFFAMAVVSPVFAFTSEYFENMDENALKAGISKYILTRGGKINHENSYNSNTIQAIEQLGSKHGYETYQYVFKIVPDNNGTRLDLNVFKAVSGLKSETIDTVTEQKIMENISTTIRGRFLYGLGFDYDYYNGEYGKIKAPKGKNTGGIVLTGVKYDAQKQGLLIGDIITEINGVPLKDIPLSEYATALNARSLTDKLELTCKRSGMTYKVTLSPRLSNIKRF